MRSLDSILSDEPSVHTLPESQSDSAPVEHHEQATESSASETPAPIKTAAPKMEAKPAAEHDDEHDEDQTPDDLAGLKRALAAARGDKRKARKQWQETERALAELRGRLSAMQPAQRAEPEKSAPQLDLTEDDFFGKGPAAVKSYVERFVEQRVSAVQQEAERRFVVRSEAAARSRYSDFDDTIAAFGELVKSNPSYLVQMREAPDPAEFAYQSGKTYSELRGVNSLDELRERIRAEVRAEFEGGGKQPAQVSPTIRPPKPQVPKSLASARGTGVGVTREWAGPRSLDDILG